MIPSLETTTVRMTTMMMIMRMMMMITMIIVMVMDMAMVMMMRLGEVGEDHLWFLAWSCHHAD